MQWNKIFSHWGPSLAILAAILDFQLIGGGLQCEHSLFHLIPYTWKPILRHKNYCNRSNSFIDMAILQFHLGPGGHFGRHLGFFKLLKGDNVPPARKWNIRTPAISIKWEKNFIKHFRVGRKITSFLPDYIAQCLTSHFEKNWTRLSHWFACSFEQYILIEECISDGGAIQVTYKLH